MVALGGEEKNYCAVTYVMMMMMMMIFRQTWAKERSLLTVLRNRTFCLTSITVYSKVIVSSWSYKETGNEGLNHPKAVSQHLQPAVCAVCIG